MTNLVISNFRTGFENDIEPFLVNNDAFPVINNAFCWRGKVKRKRGTKLLGRLQRTLTSQSIGVTDGAGNYSGNVITLLSLGSLSSIVPGSISITVAGAPAQVFTEPATPDGTLTNGAGGTGTINYRTGAITLNTNPNLLGSAVTITFSYYPTLPVMGLEEFDTSIINEPRTVALDTKYAYEYDQTTELFYDVSFYKNSHAPVTWSGTDFQQFWSANFQGAMWVTNGRPGFNFKNIENVPVVGANSQFTITGHGLSNTDYVYINEVNGITGVNEVSGLVTVVDANNFTIPTPGAAGAYISGGIAFYLTRSAGAGLDGIRWYDGDPVADATKGWVNFAPPTSKYDPVLNPNPQYIVGAKIIIPFKDRLLFFAPTTQTSIGAPIYQPNQLMWSQNGTVYYAAPVPTNQTFQIEAWYQNIVGRGGRLGAPIQDEIVTVDENEDILLVGFFTRPLKLYYTSDDSNPFLYQTINTELGSEATFASVSLDTGALTVGEYGFALITQNTAQRIDLQIPDEVFAISANNNGIERITGIRDFRNEFVYFTYPYSETWIYPNRTLLYSYRDNNWATLDEIYTTYGRFRKNRNYTWGTIGTYYPTWKDWNDPWSFGSIKERYPAIVGGNQHGFVLVKDDGTTEAQAFYINNISGTTIFSTNHCLNDGDYILIDGIIGTNNLNSTIQRITVDLSLKNQFEIETPFVGTYIGGGTYKRFSVPNIQSKQFPTMWGEGLQTIITTQRFMFTRTDKGQVTLQVFTSQDNSQAANDASYLPYSNIVLTSKENNLLVAKEPDQIWHRLSNSFIGDTVQFGITLSDAQMRNNDINETEIVLHAVCLTLEPGPVLF